MGKKSATTEATVSQETETADPITALVKDYDRRKLADALTYWESVKSLTVRGQIEYDNAMDVCKEVKKQYNMLETRRKELTSSLNAQVKYINGEFSKVTSALDNGEKQLKRGMINWKIEEDRRVEEENRKREAEAEEKRRKEQERAEADTKKADEYREQGREKMADQAEARAQTHIARAEEETPVVELNRAKGKGGSFTYKYIGTLSDKAAFVREALDKHPEYLAQVDVNLKPFEAQAKAFDGQMNIPGISFRREVDMSVRTK